MCIGTEVRPYLDGKKKTDWEKNRSKTDKDAIFSQLSEIRQSVIDRLNSSGHPRHRTNSSANTSQWFKGFPSTLTFNSDDRISDIMEAATDLAQLIEELTTTLS